jgi:hypothetical protein
MAPRSALSAHHLKLRGLTTCDKPSENNHYILLRLQFLVTKLTTHTQKHNIISRDALGNKIIQPKLALSRSDGLVLMHSGRIRTDASGERSHVLERVFLQAA